ncbi:MAG TPA: hypothetical protein VIT38_01595 [Allosphingosinicella sp.]
MNTSPVRARILVNAVIAAGLLASCNRSSAPPAGDAALATASDGLVQVCQNPLPIPANFDYPQTAATVTQWVNSGNAARARVHGWNVWAALNTAPAGTPVWRSWCTSTQAFSTAGVGAAMDSATPIRGQNAMNARNMINGPTTGEDPINFPNPPYYPVPQQIQARYPQCYNSNNGQLLDGPTFQNNGDIMVAGVIYDAAAYSWIRSQNLYLASTLQAQLPPSNQTRQMAAMPAGSIVLKPMMWPVRGDGLTALPVWDGPTSDNGQYAGYEIQSMWPRAVAITTTPQSTIANADVTYLYGVWTNNMLGRRLIGPLTYRAAPVVPIQRFYHFRFPSLDGMAPCDRAILDASAYWAYGREFRAGDYLAVVAMHMMTKEQPAWTFQSVWWHDRPDAGPYAADRPNIPPAQAPGPWRHYLMASTYGIPAPGGTNWPIQFNPYIELAAAHPIRTNCMNCHHRAAWGGGSYEAQSPPGPDALAIYQLNNAIFNGLLGVDSLWSINDRATAPSAGGGAASPARPSGTPPPAPPGNAQ